MGKIKQGTPSKPRTPAGTDTGLSSRPGSKSMAGSEPGWAGGPSLAGHVAITDPKAFNRRAGEMAPQVGDPTEPLFPEQPELLD